MNTQAALIVVDVQNDFCEGGSLAVAGGAATAGAISRHLAAHRDRYAVVIGSLDWHRPGSDNQGHIALPPKQPDFVDSWPPHCIAGTPGAELHPALDADLIDLLVRKGYGMPSYSAFEGYADGGRELHRVLTDRAVNAVEIVGIATDYCVKATALSARAHGFPTAVRLDLTAAVRPGDVGSTVDDLIAAGVTVRDA